jgi:hypothetical protein
MKFKRIDSNSDNVTIRENGNWRIVCFKKGGSSNEKS